MTRIPHTDYEGEQYEPDNDLLTSCFNCVSCTGVYLLALTASVLLYSAAPRIHSAAAGAVNAYVHKTSHSLPLQCSTYGRAVYQGSTLAARLISSHCNPPTVIATQAASEPVPPLAKLAAFSYIAKYSPEQAEYIADLLYRHFGKDALLFAIIVRRESGYNLTARNHSSGCYGLFQLHPCHKAALKKLGLDFNSVEDQATFAKMLYDAQGTAPWAVAGAAKRELRRVEDE